VHRKELVYGRRRRTIVCPVVKAGIAEAQKLAIGGRGTPSVAYADHGYAGRILLEQMLLIIISAVPEFCYCN